MRLAFTVALIAGAVLLRIDDDQRVRLTGVRGMSLVLPDTCLLKTRIGIHCPTCGVTRSMICLSHGRIRSAWNHNPAGLLVFAGILYFALRPIRETSISDERWSSIPWPLCWWAIAVISVLVVQWVWRMGRS
jgi:hypothetical protein